VPYESYKNYYNQFLYYYSFEYYPPIISFTLIGLFQTKFSVSLTFTWYSNNSLWTKQLLSSTLFSPPQILVTFGLFIPNKAHHVDQPMAKNPFQVGLISMMKYGTHYTSGRLHSVCLSQNIPPVRVPAIHITATSKFIICENRLMKHQWSKFDYRTINIHPFNWAYTRKRNNYSSFWFWYEFQF